MPTAPDHSMLPIYRRGQGIVAHAKVDRDDLARVGSFKWYLFEHGYQRYARRIARRPDGSQVQVLLHRQVLNLTAKDPLVDHINGDGLDCRRRNLRVTNNSVNRINTDRVRQDSGTGVKGVRLDPRYGTYNVYLKRDGKKRSFGAFPTLEEAAKVAEEVYGANRV